MLPLRSLSFDEIAPDIKPGDLLLYIDPTLALPRKPSMLNTIGNIITSVLATVPIFNGLSGAASRADWTSVACMTTLNQEPHLIAFGQVEDPEPHKAFCFVKVTDLFDDRNVKRFAVRPLFSTGVREEKNMCIQIARILMDLNANSESATNMAARSDDVVLTNEMYWRLTGASISDADGSTSPRRTVSQIFATGGLMDSVMLDTNSRKPCQFGAEICGWVPYRPRPLIIPQLQ